MNIEFLTKPVRKVLPLKRCGAVIVAAGNASRMGGTDKIMAPLGGKTVIARTVAAFQECDAVAEIVIVTREDLILPVTGLCRRFSKVAAVVAGGATRQESVMLGLNTLSKGCALVAIQDGARPLVTWQLIDRVIRAANTYGAAAPGVPVKDTIKMVEGRVIQSTPERKKLFAVQTPQVFDRDLLRGALAKAKKDALEITDDCSAVEHMGMKIKLVEGDERNLKITTPLDLKLAQMLLEEEV